MSFLNWPSSSRQNEPFRVKIGQIEAKIGEKVCPVSQLTVALRCWAAGLMTQQSSMTSSPCQVPKRFFRPVEAQEFWLFRGFSCVSCNRVDMDTLPELRASIWHDFCIIRVVHNRDTCWVIRGCRAKKRTQRRDTVHKRNGLQGVLGVILPCKVTDNLLDEWVNRNGACWI